MSKIVRNGLIFVIVAVGIGAAVVRSVGVGGAQKKPEAAHGHGSKDEHGHDHSDGKVELNDAKVAASGIELVKAGPATIRETLVLNGVLQPNQEALVHVTPRFPGVVREVRKRIGETVEKDTLLAKIESNQSLTSYDMRSPISGTVTDRQLALGEYASEQKAAFSIVDLSTVWVDLSVFRRDLPRVKPGDTVLIDPEDGGQPIEAKISYISPVGTSDTQSTIARAVVANKDMRLRPGLFITAKLILTAKPVAIAVKASALQTVDNKTIVFVRNGTKFEPREVELGDKDAEWIEVLFGLLEGDTYAARNSFVVKAELAKGTATHEH